LTPFAGLHLNSCKRREVSVLSPGPDHPISIAKHPNRVRVTFNGKVVAESVNVLMLREADYPPVFYFPREDVRNEYFKPTGRSTTCPYKGPALYFSLVADGRHSENAVWLRERPYPCAKQLDQHFAFYADKVDAIEEL
jgi:uncharacterized protein (DUF427 family)